MFNTAYQLQCYDEVHVLVNNFEHELKFSLQRYSNHDHDAEFEEDRQRNKNRPSLLGNEELISIQSVVGFNF